MLIAIWPSTYRAARAANLSWEEIDTLCQEGVALAFVRFDPSRGASIGTAISWNIRAVVGRAVSQARTTTSSLENVSAEIDHRAKRTLGYDCNDECLSTKKALSSDFPHTIHNNSNNDLSQYLTIANLTPKERNVLVLRFGLTDETPLSISSIGFAMGLSPERIRQLQERAIRKIRRALGLDIDWAIATRSRILAYLSTLKSGAFKAEICKRTGATTWQFREVISRLLKDGHVTRERMEVNRGRWRIVYSLRATNLVFEPSRSRESSSR
jgi:RNA polymerase sigma factor (sigma-70 family)